MNSTNNNFKSLENYNIFKTILEDSLAGYWDLNIAENKEYLSSTFKAMLGYNDDELEEEPGSWKNLILPQDRLKAERNLAQHVDSRGVTPHRIELRFRHKSGQIVWVLCTAKVLAWDDNGKPQRIVGCHLDITIRKKIEEDLAQSVAQFKGAFEYSAIGMALVSVEGKWLRVNRRLCEMLGYTENELLNSTFQDITHPDDLNLDLENLDKMLKGEIESYQMEKRYYHKNGSILWVLLSVSLVLDSQNKPLHFVSQIENITQRVYAKEALEKANRELTRQNEILGNFAHITSHNLRAPVSNLSTLLMIHGALEPGPEKDDIFNKLQTVVDHLTDTLSDLNATLTVTENKNVERENLSLEKAVEKAKAMLAGEIIETKAIIKTDFSKCNEVLYNETYLDSIILNLMSNALKYKSDHRNPVVKIWTDIDEGGVKLMVEDNGLGIDLKRHGRKIFGLHKTFHKHKEAKGLGLFMTKTQVEAMGGSITVQSKLNVGTKFTVELLPKDYKDSK